MKNFLSNKLWISSTLALSSLGLWAGATGSGGGSGPHLKAYVKKLSNPANSQSAELNEQCANFARLASDGLRVLEWMYEKDNRFQAEIRFSGAPVIQHSAAIPGPKRNSVTDKLGSAITTTYAAFQDEETFQQAQKEAQVSKEDRNTFSSASMFLSVITHAGLENLKQKVFRVAPKDIPTTFLDNNGKTLAWSKNSIEASRRAILDLCKSDRFVLNPDIKDSEGRPLMAQNSRNGLIEVNLNEWTDERVAENFDCKKPLQSIHRSQQQIDLCVIKAKRAIAVHEILSLPSVGLEADGLYPFSSLILGQQLREPLKGTQMLIAENLYKSRVAGQKISRKSVSSTEYNQWKLEHSTLRNELKLVYEQREELGFLDNFNNEVH